MNRRFLTLLIPSLIAALVVLAAGLLIQPVKVPTLAERLAAIKDGETITLPDGVVTINQPLRIANKIGVTIQGGAKTVIEYVGQPCEGIVDCENFYRSSLRNITIVNRANGVESCVRLGTSREVVQGYFSSANRLENLVCHWDADSKLVKYCFSVDNSLRDQNNDLHQFVDCSGDGASIAIYRVTGSQCHDLVFDSCQAKNNAPSEKPWPLGSAKYGYLFDGAFFEANHCRSGGFEIDWQLGRITSATIRNSNSEWSRQFVVTDKTGARGGVYLIGGRWDGLPVKDLPVVDYFGQGHFALKDMTICCSLDRNVMPMVKASCYSDARRFQMIGTAEIVGNTFLWNGTDPRTANISVPMTWDATIGSNMIQVNGVGGKYSQRWPTSVRPQ